MKRTKIFITAILSLMSFAWAAAQDGDTDETPWPAELWKAKSPVEINREPPRTPTVCYDSEQAALSGSLEASEYLQPLTKWERSAGADGNTVSYKHSFKFPFAWADRQLLLFIGSANAPYEVIINGKPAGYNQSPNTPAEFNITTFSNEGVNSVEIVLHGDAQALILGNNPQPLTPRITGDTYISSQPRVMIRDFITRTALSGDDAMLELGVILKSQLLNPKTLTIYYSLFSPTGENVATGRRQREIEMRQEDTVYFTIDIPQAKLWSPETPQLYTLLLKTQNEGRYWEYVAYKIGLRTVSAGNGKFLVNGMEFPIYLAEYQTTSREETLRAIPDLKKQGINLITVNSPQPEWFYDLCDEAGFFVFPQADIDTRRSGESRRKDGNPANDPQWENAYRDRTEAAYYTTLNHPSVVGFSLAANSANGYNMYEAYLNLKKILVRNGDLRPVIFDKAGGEWNTDVVDVETYNTKPQTVGHRLVLGKDAAPVNSSPVTISVDNARTGQFTVRNNLFFTTINAPLSYTVKQGNSKVSSGIVDISLDPSNTATVNIPYGKAQAGKKALSVTLSIQVAPYEQAMPQEVTQTFTVEY